MCLHFVIFRRFNYSPAVAIVFKSCVHDSVIIDYLVGTTVRLLQS